MRVMLVNPPPGRYVERYDRPDYGHIGMAYVAGALEQRGLAYNKDLFVVDAKLARMKTRRVMDLVRECGPQVVGLTAYTFDILHAGRLAALIKELDPRIVTVIGGVHSSAIPEETLRRIPSFDVAMIGECEETFHQVVQRIEAGEQTFEGITGIAWRTDGAIRCESTITRYDDLDAAPFPAWHMMPQASEYQIMTARGCPRACVFCMSPYGRRYIREMSPGRVIAEMEWVVRRFHPAVYKFNDETFAFNAERMHRVLDLMIEKELGKATKFVGSMRADKMDSGILRKMKRANFYAVEVGVETGDPGIMRKIKKGETLEETEQAVRWVKEAGMEVWCGFIIGHPGETYETAMTTIEYAARLNPTVAAFGLMVPYPGTEVAEYAQKGLHGYRLLSTDWFDYNKQYGNALELDELPRGTMERLQAYAYLKVFIANRRYREAAGFLWAYRKAGWAFLVKQLRPGRKRPRDREQVAMVDTGLRFLRRNYRS
jgi:anaerobic magnesium-protoporphyrin IX monomethyl ester cyclase